MNENYRYQEKFSGNIFVLGQIVSRRQRKKIASCFENTPISFSYLTNIDKFNALIQNSQWKTKEEYDDEFKNENILGEKRVDKLIVMDNVLGLVISLINLVDFLTVSRKFGYMLFFYFIPYIRQMSTGK